MSKKLQILRNRNLFENRAAAASALRIQLQNLEDGELCLARYKDGDNVATVMGVAAKVSATEGGDNITTPTIFDTASVPADVQSALNALVLGAGLSGEGAYVKDTTGNSVIAGATSLADADRILSDKILAMDYALDAADGKLVKSVSQVDGTISATSEYLVDKDVKIVAKESGLAETSLAEYTLKNGNGTDLGATIVIPKDKSLEGVQMVTSWGEGGTTKTGLAFEFTYNNAQGGQDKVYLDTANLLYEAEFKDGLQVVGGNVSVKLDATAGSDSAKFLKFVGEEDGKKSIGLDGITNAITTAVAAKNVDAEGDDYVSATAANNKVTVATDVQDVSANAGTRGTWSVTDAGVATLTGETAPSINGVEKSLVDGKQAIEAVKTYVDAKVAVEAAERTAKIEGAVKALDAEVASMNGDVTAEKKVKVAITEVDGKLTNVAVTTSDIASATDLSNEISRATAAEAQALTDAKAYTNTKIQNLDVDSVTVATKDANGVVTLTKAVQEVDGKIAAVGGTDSTIALAKVATTGVAADVVLTGYTKASSITSIAATDSVKVALGKLEKKADSTLNEVEAGNGINVSGISGQKQTVSVKLDTTTATDSHPENALSVGTDGLYLSSVWDCGEY